MAKKKATQEKTVGKSPKISKFITELNTIIKDMGESDLSSLIEQARKIKHGTPDSKTSSDSKNVQDARKGAAIEIIPDESKNSFIVKINNSRKLFTRPDFRNMVKVCQGNEKNELKAANLYRWLLKERKDFLIDLNIKKAIDPRLIQLIELIKSKYKVKGN